MDTLVDTVDKFKQQKQQQQKGLRKLFLLGWEEDLRDTQEKRVLYVNLVVHEIREEKPHLYLNFVLSSFPPYTVLKGRKIKSLTMQILLLLLNAFMFIFQLDFTD